METDQHSDEHTLKLLRANKSKQESSDDGTSVCSGVGSEAVAGIELQLIFGCAN
ncbi:MAG: hypothetical protein QNJ09_14630 [Paracoccaceae bacterium]|nr:hypothetical protein [Paracoccaceae bacterium]